MKPFLLRGWCAAALIAVMALAGCGGGAAPPAAEGAKADTVPAFTGNGIWWNPAESGSGFFFEAQGATGVVTFYMYETSGRAVWYTGPGAFAAVAGGKYKFDGALQRYTGGQSGKALTPKPPSGSSPAGTVTITFDGFKAQGTVAGRAFTAQKFFQSGEPATKSQPETGIYWNPLETGRGYTIEVNNNTAVVTAFHYTDDGLPQWHLITVPWPSGAGGTATGDFTAFSGGQPLAGAYKAPTGATVEGKLALSFNASCNGSLAFPDLPSIGIKRFAFGSLAVGGECRSTSGTGTAVDRADAFAGTWIGCLVISQQLSRQETWVFEKKQDGSGRMLYTISVAQYPSGDCSGAATPVSQLAGTFDFAAGTGNILSGVVMQGVMDVNDNAIKRTIGIQADGQMRVGDQDFALNEQGYATRLTGVAYRKQ